MSKSPQSAKRFGRAALASSAVAGLVVTGLMAATSGSATAVKYGVNSIPTMNVYVGGQVVKSIVGAKPKPMILKDIESFI